MHKEISFRIRCVRKIMTMLARLSKGALIFPVLFCISCTSLNIASREGKTLEASGRPEKSQSVPSQLCKPLSEGFYVVQAGAFNHISYAQALRKKLEEKGYESYITVSGFSEEKRIFRVLIGRFTDRQQAQALSEEIKKKTNLDVIVALKPLKDKFVVQAGCFKGMAEAKALRKKLADNGHNAYITFTGTGNDKQYNVLLGEFLDRTEAEKMSEEVSQKEHIHVFVNTI
jgi:cell division septation protein DedD